jgi:hypothetical protein
MTLRESSGPTEYELEPAPAGGIEAVKAWAYEMLQRLVNLQQQPRVQSVMFARLESATDAAIVRPGEGMMIFAAADVLGAGKLAGFYVYEGATWKRLQSV